jgi:hypothetical protein
VAEIFVKDKSGGYARAIRRSTNRLSQTKRRPVRAPFVSSSDATLLRRRVGAAAALELLALLFSALLQLFLQLLLVSSNFRIGRRAVIGLANSPAAGQRQRRAVGVIA